MKLFGFDINVQRREAAPGVPSSTMEGIKDGKDNPAVKAEGANYAERIVYANSPQTALTVAAYYRAVELRARTMGLMPIQYQRLDTLGHNFITDMKGFGKRMNYLFGVRPNPIMTASQMSEMITTNQIAFGNGFVYMECDEMDFPLNLWVVEYGSYNLATGLYTLTYLSDAGYVTKVNVPRQYVLHFPNTYKERGGVWGISTIRYMIQTLSYIRTQQQQTLETAAKGGRVKGFISEDKQPGQLGLGMYNKQTTDDYAKELQGKFYGGQDIVSLRGVTKFENLSMTAADMQSIENLGISNDDIARFLAVPRPLLMLDTNSHYNDYSNATMEFHTRTILPEKNAREQEIFSKLYELLPRSIFDFGRNRIHICERPLMAMDPERQAKVDLANLQTGVKTVNELRAEHDMPAVEFGDKALCSTNLAELGSPKLRESGGGRPTEDKTEDGKTEGEEGKVSQ